MPPPSPPAFSVPKFLIRALPWAALAAWVWNGTYAHNAAFTVWITKRLHGLLGFPAPYLFCDERHLFWHATLFPPAVALTLASYWLGWPDRLLRAIAGYLIYAGLTAIAITIHESPYVQQTEFLRPLTSTLVNANYLVFGVAIWILAASPWYGTVQPARLGTSVGSPTNDPPQPAAEVASRLVGKPGSLGRAWRIIRQGWFTRLLVMWLATFCVIPLYAMTGTKTAMAARWQMARALDAVPFFPQPSFAPPTVSREVQTERDHLTVAALEAIKKAINADEADQLQSAPLWHLTGHLLISLHPPDPERQKEYRKQGLIALEAAKRTRS